LTERAEKVNSPGMKGSVESLVVTVIRSLAPFLLIAACAPAPKVPAARAPAPTTRPPAATTHSESSLPDGVDVSYTIELVQEPFPYIAVTLVTHGTATGHTMLGLDNWGGIDHAEREVHRVTVTDDQGRALLVDHANTFESSGNAPLWIVHHPPGAVLHIHYALVSTQYDVGGRSDSYFRPLEQASFFHIIGNTALFDVRDTPSDTHQRIALHWRGFKEAGWKVASSFSVEQSDFEVTETLDNFRQAVFLAGDLRLLRRDIGPTKSPLWLAIAGSDWGFTDDAFADLAASVVTAQRSFFQDYDWPFFLVSVIPVGVYRAGAYSQGGTGLSQSFATFLTPKTELVFNADGTGVPWLLSHELFHLWNGRRYQIAEPEALGYWFSEGFTNFYARRLSLRAGITDKKTFVANLNDEVMRYTLSPLKAKPASTVAADFWKNDASQKLPYYRGDVVALLADAEIRKVSHGDKSLDDLMREMLAAHHDVRPTVTTDTFLATIASYTSAEFADRIRKVVVDGTVPPINPNILEPCLHGHIESIGPYELGFDETATRARHVAVGVVPGSSAYQAGLRNGQKLEHFSIHRGDPRHPVEATLEDGGAKRIVSYLPQGKPVNVVQFSAEAVLPPVCGRTL